MKYRALGVLFSGLLVSAGGCGGDSIVDPTPPETLEDAPTLKSVTPATGPAAGGTPVVIQGSNFNSATSVRFGGVEATTMTVVSDTSISVKTPPGVGGPVTVTVENSQQRVGNLVNAYTYKKKVEPPPVTTVCKIATTTPSLGAKDVDVVGDLHVKWSHAIDSTTLAANVVLSVVGGEPVDATVTPDGDDGAIVHPASSLRFWGSYQLSIAEGVTADDGTPCDAAAIAFATRIPEAAPRALHAAPIWGLVANGDKILAASYRYRGFQTYDLAGAKPAEPIGEVLTEQSPFRVVVDGDVGYAAAGAEGVLLLDMTSTPPTVVSHFGTLGVAIDVAAFAHNGSQYLLIADNVGGARLVDVTDPAGPIDKGVVNLGTWSGVNAVTVSGDLAVFGVDDHLAIARIGGAGVPTFSVLSTPSAVRTVNSVVIGGTVAYAAIGSDLASFDLTDPAAPVLVTQVAGPAGDCGTYCEDMKTPVIDGNDLYVTDLRSGAVRYTLDGHGGMIPAATYPVSSAARGVAVSGGKVIVGADEGLLVFDRDAPNAPVAASAGGVGQAKSVLVSGDAAYVAADLVGVLTYDLTSPEAPAFTKRVTTPASLARNLGPQQITSIPGGGLLVSDGRASIATLDVSTPTQPTLAGSLDLADLAAAAFVDGTTAYACDGNTGLQIIDLADVAHPALLGTAHFPTPDGCVQPVKIGSFVYLAAYNGLRIVDVSDPAAPKFVGAATNVPPHAGVAGIAAVGSRLFAVFTQRDLDAPHGVHQLASLDLATPTAPAVTWISDDLGAGGAIASTGDLVVIAGADKGVLFFDIADPAKPIYEGTVPMPGVVQGVAFGDGVVYVAQAEGGLQAIRTGKLPQ